MLRITCPCCGADGEETEFVCGGEAHIVRPNSESATDVEWAAYLFERSNPIGPRLERWRHVFGCGKWFHLARDSVTHVIYGTYDIRATEPPPDIAERIRREQTHE